MRAQYWDFIVTTKYHLLYAEKYHEHARNINNSLTVFSLLLSSSAIAGWMLWQQLPWLWSILIAISQVLSVCKPFLPYTERMTSLRFFIPELKAHLADLENQWNRLNNAEDSQFAKSLEIGRNRSVTLESKYLGTQQFPAIHRILDKSWTECKDYMQTYFPHQEGSGQHEAIESTVNHVG